MGATSFSSMVYKDAEKLYAEVRTDTEALVDRALSCTQASSHFHLPSPRPLRDHSRYLPTTQRLLHGGTSCACHLAREESALEKYCYRRQVMGRRATTSWQAAQAVDLSCPARLAPRTSMVRRPYSYHSVTVVDFYPWIAL